MKRELDDILKHALTPKEEPDFWMNEKILSKAKEREKMALGKRTKRFIPAAALSAAVIFTIGSVSVYAAWKYLTPEQIVEETGDEKLSKVFAGEDAVRIDETQSYGGYDVTLLGIASGNSISDYFSEHNGKIQLDRTYVVTAIAKSDGTPMPASSDAAYGKEDFFVSPLLLGYEPWKYNVYTFRGNYSEIVRDGILYRITECGNVEYFADRGVYLCVSDGTSYNTDAYIYDEATGKISRNDSYEGLNALFSVPFDAAKADSEAAEKMIEEIDREISNDNSKGETEDFMPADVQAFMEKLTPENISQYADPIESTRQTAMPDEQNCIHISYELENGAGGEGFVSMDAAFPDKKPGMSSNFDYSCSDDEMESLLISTYTLNEDGTITFVVYSPKMN